MMTKGRTTALVVEDSCVQAQSIGRLLGQAGLHVLYASEGEVGVQMAQEHLPEVIILDLQMPGMNGLEVCSQLKRSMITHHIPIIMLTQHDDPELVTLGLQSGAVDYIPKDGFAEAVLVETLRQMGLIAPADGAP